MLKDADQNLIDLLRQNARMSVSALARALDVSRSTVQDRLARLEADGTIAGYRVQLGDRVEASRLKAQVLLKIAPQALTDVIAACRHMQAVKSLSTTAGEYNALVMVSAGSAPDLDKTLEQLDQLKGVERSQACVILAQKFERVD